MQLDHYCIMSHKECCKALFVQNKYFITLAECPDHPLAFESAQVLHNIMFEVKLLSQKWHRSTIIFVIASLMTIFYFLENKKQYHK